MERFEIALPGGYRLHDLLAFHGRDAESVAEEVKPDRLRKGVLLDGVPVVLDIALGADRAACAVLADGDPAAHAAVAPLAREAALNILGLRIDPQPFLDFAAGDALLGELSRRQPGLRIVQSATVFEALTWAIIGQQINLPFAIALRRTFILRAGRRHSGGLWCYPDAASAAGLDPDELLTRKFSRAKAETLLRFSALVASGELNLEPGPGNDIEDIGKALLAVKGIGPWTVNYGLLRGYGYADCSLHGDVAIRAALQALLGEEAKPDMARTEAILKRYAPHRTMAAAHLWASLHPRGDDGQS
ncbi:DNA-3-methyladenine glycosylase 2 [Pseudoduganella namucuonensis]|uniref:DNA-3-methyladenine glycosylase II n=1 Tax=Pseudoduganella namucuonensis TaxID=1035707 RepID=A0A1I7LR56_9BURK|nr:DNA-3-methyladenine glycosylase 2 [Pseudoduganella namucuonensis]SFV12050.1 DNA-3-methyladenine glycosylase II [Pseudoduganella namucuonensis]